MKEMGLFGKKRERKEEVTRRKDFFAPGNEGKAVCKNNEAWVKADGRRGGGEQRKKKALEDAKRHVIRKKKTITIQINITHRRGSRIFLERGRGLVCGGCPKLEVISRKKVIRRGGRQIS